MDTQQELNHILLAQDFENDTILSDRLRVYKQAACMYAQIENAIAVLSDLCSNKSYIYYGGAGKTLGFTLPKLNHETGSIWEKEIFDRVLPDDLVRKHVQELRFFHFVKEQPFVMRSRYYLEMYIRMKDKKGTYTAMRHRMFYVVNSQTGNIILVLCIYTLCANLLPDVLVDSFTGEKITIEQQPCGICLSKREKEILKQIAKGKMSKEIADCFSISIHTVSRHRQNILKKLQVDNSIQSLEVAKELHLI